MNREIKFRGYLKDSFFKGKEKHPSYEPLLDKRIVKIHSIHFNSKKVIISCPTGGNMSVEFKDIEIMQYTGLKDKNGKEIYEGDIIDIHQTVNGYNLFVIEYYVYKFNARYYDKDKKVIGSLYNYDLDDLFQINEFEKEFEVVGNIYESEEKKSE